MTTTAVDAREDAREDDARAGRMGRAIDGDDDDARRRRDDDGGDGGGGDERERRWVLPGVDARGTRDDLGRGVATTEAGGVLAGGFRVRFDAVSSGARTGLGAVLGEFGSSRRAHGGAARLLAPVPTGVLAGGVRVEDEREGADQGGGDFQKHV